MRHQFFPTAQVLTCPHPVLKYLTPCLAFGVHTSLFCTMCSLCQSSSSRIRIAGATACLRHCELHEQVSGAYKSCHRRLYFKSQRRISSKFFQTMHGCPCNAVQCFLCQECRVRRDKHIGSSQQQCQLAVPSQALLLHTAPCEVCEE